ncbi:MAG: type II secretion system F family protein [Candidatus Omnitrophica bacterium]|nr:type II secretion system F family protein [Candidatus Omnitrophota bacterium]MDD5553776.1 type II secretion system F family protein [Candidatus Omnitrophota bacterium]
MELLAIFLLLAVGVGLLAYQLSAKKLVGEVHLPQEIKGHSDTKGFDFKEALSAPAWVTGKIVQKTDLPLENLKRKLISAGNPMHANMFLTIKFILAAGLPVAAFIILRPQSPIILIIPLLFGLALPDMWLKAQIKKRHSAILKDLPHVIDLLNICVGAGLDFMVAVARVIHEFKSCVLIDELKVLMREIQMGSARKDALKSLAKRVNSPEVISFARTLIQADRMGTPIGEALKMQAEEIRLRRFQRGEEMGLKAPVKLLFPLLFFILPVVLIIVAGPILIQFTRGGFINF